MELWRNGDVNCTAERSRDFDFYHVSIRHLSVRLPAVSRAVAVDQ